MSKPVSRGTPCGGAAEADDGVAQRAVVQVDAAAPEDAARVDAQGVALLQVVVDQGGEQVVGRGDGVEVAVEMQVDVLPGLDPRKAAAGGAALHAEDRAERRLAQGQRDLFADVLQSLRKADRGDGFAFAGVGRGDRRDQHQLAARAFAFEGGEADLGFGVAVGDEVGLGDAELLGDFGNRSQRHGESLFCGLSAGWAGEA